LPDAVSQLIADARTEGAFDATDAQLLRWLDRRHKQMCAASLCYRKTATIGGGSVAGQTVYSPPAGLVRTLEVTVGGLTYGKANHSDIAASAQGWLALDGPGGVFTESRDAAGARQIVLLPAPSESGDVIGVYGAFRPPTLLQDDSVPVQVDDEAVEGLLAGVFATGLSRPSEARADLAVSHEQVFAAATQDLAARVMRAFRTRAPAQIRLRG
jgi:hypothetical protein